MIGHCGRRERIQFDRGFRRRLTAPNSAIAMVAKPSAPRSASLVKKNAMMRIAMRSSSTASASRKMRTRVGRNRPNTASTPSAKAMSVAVGMGQPSTVGVPAVNARKIAAGTTTPPTAAIAGSSAFEREFSSPITSSRFSSTATMKKKIASRPSLIQCPAERSSPSHGRSRWASLTSTSGGSERQVRDDEAEHGRDQEQCGGEALGAEEVHGTPVGKSRCDGEASRGARVMATTSDVGRPGFPALRRHPIGAPTASA